MSPDGTVSRLLEGVAVEGPDHQGLDAHVAASEDAAGTGIVTITSLDPAGRVGRAVINLRRRRPARAGTLFYTDEFATS